MYPKHLDTCVSSRLSLRHVTSIRWSGNLRKAHGCARPANPIRNSAEPRIQTKFTDYSVRLVRNYEEDSIHLAYSQLRCPPSSLNLARQSHPHTLLLRSLRHTVELKVVLKQELSKLMEGGKLRNYLRTYRKRSGLSQQEVASIVARKHSAAVSHYEWGRRLPSLRTALALEVLFGVPVGQLFVGDLETIKRETEERLQKLENTLQNTSCVSFTATMTAKKLVWLTGRRMDFIDD